MEDHETNTGWWTEKPDRLDRPSSYSRLSGGSRPSGRAQHVWLSAALVVGLMVALGWAVLRLASA